MNNFYQRLNIKMAYAALMIWAAIASMGLNAATTNPLLFADFSDPDVIRHGDTYYMVASSFNHMPGVPVLASKDLLNWRRLGFVMQNHPQKKMFATPQHGKGLWAPCLRYHDGKFWVFMPDPDHGIYVSSAVDPAGEWSEPHLLLPGRGIIDPTPLWDDDGQAYLLHGWAKSRAGFNNVLTLHRMSADASKVLDQGKLIVDGHKLKGFRTLEGPKFYQRNGYYYIFAPAGGVREGWQTVFRARNIEGPYEHRITLEQGSTIINGPHQGAWVISPDEREWFIHFQDRGAFGRIVHLQTLSWQDDWPIMGRDYDGNGIGEPEEKLALAGPQAPLGGLALSDEFSSSQLGAQWQWNANWRSDWYSLKAIPGQLRLYAQAAQPNLWQQPALLTQMFVGPRFTATTQLQLNSPLNTKPPSLGSQPAAVQSGLLVYGNDYAWLGLRTRAQGYSLVYESCLDARKGCTPESKTIMDLDLNSGKVELKVDVDEQAIAHFYYRLSSNDSWQQLDQPGFKAKRGRWVGARVGVFAEYQNKAGDKTIEPAKAFADFDYFRVAVTEDK